MAKGEDNLESSPRKWLTTDSPPIYDALVLVEKIGDLSLVWRLFNNIQLPF
jgi:hypothetical protein